MISDDLLVYLEAEELGIMGETLFRNNMPDKPDECIMLYEYGAESPVYSKGGVEVQRPRFQIISRSPSHSRAMQMSIKAFVALATIKNAVLNGSSYERIRALDAPSVDPSGRDEKNRALIRCNYAIRKQF